MSIILERALKLPIPDRRKRADDIYASLESEDGFALSDEQKAEHDRRLADTREHPEKLIPPDVVKDRLRNIA